MIIRSSDGTLLFSRSFRAANPRGSLLVVHGLGEHSGRYQELVDHALKLRVSVHVFDLRGHGRSQGTRGHFESFTQLHEDMDAWIAHLVASGEISDKQPCLILGHSLGALIALTFVARYVPQPLAPPISGLILSAPFLGMRWNPMRLIEAQLARKVPGFLSNIQVPCGIAPEDLSHSAEEVERYVNDPLVHGWITPAAFRAIEGALASLPRLIPHLSLPMLFLLSGKDKVVDTHAAQEFAAKLTVAHPHRVEVKLFHGFFHEPMHEARKERVFLEIKKWVLQCLIPAKTEKKTASSKSSAKGATARATLH
jgi:acylglycerol lipase